MCDRAGCACGACVPGLENSLFSLDPSDPTWRTLDPGSSDSFGIPSDTADGIGGDEAGDVWRPRARARLGMVGAPGGLYLFGGQGQSIEDYVPIGPRDVESIKNGAW